MAEGKRENRKLVRLLLKAPLRVTIRSLGAEISYDLETRNLSYTGFFLDFEKPGRFPFTPASIMEVWIELEKEQNIFFNGKMVRKVMPGEPGCDITGPGIAVHIIQIEPKVETQLKSYIDRRVAELAAAEETHVAPIKTA
jgi:PilZ domain